MNQRIYSAFKHFAISFTLRSLSRRKRHAAFEAPQPRSRSGNVNEITEDDAWMFDNTAVNAVEHRMEMLADQMDRLSDTLSGLRAFLGKAASEAPLLAELETMPLMPPLLSDRDLFEGEPMVATPNAISAAGEADFLFQEEAVAEEHFVRAEQQARAA